MFQTKISVKEFYRRKQSVEETVTGLKRTLHNSMPPNAKLSADCKTVKAASTKNGKPFPQKCRYK